MTCAAEIGQISELVACAGEPVIVKNYPNAFRRGQTSMPSCAEHPAAN